MIQRLSGRDLPWAWLLCAGALTAIGIAFVTSATWDPTATLGMGREARQQVVWWLVGVASCLAAAHISNRGWRGLALPAYLGGLLAMLALMTLAGTSLVPRIKGQANWLVLGPVRIQPVELVKLSVMLLLARVIVAPGFDARLLSHCAGAAVVVGLPALLVAASGDLGSALTLPALLFGVLLVAGAHLRHLALGALIMLLVAVMGIAALPREGPKSYQWKRIQAWLHPDEYGLTEGFQTERAKRSIGSGQWLGKGYAAGDQNRLGWVPEKHTDMIISVVGEETGFAGCAGVLGLFAAFASLGLWHAGRSRDPCTRMVIAGFLSLLLGQAAINLSVATGLMPVTGVTLPFLSYGGSSLLSCWLGLGICIGMAASRVAPPGLGSNSQRLAL